MRASHVAVSIVVVAAALMIAWLLGTHTAEEVRQVFHWLEPTHVVELVIVLVIVAAAVSLPPTDRLLVSLVARGRAAGSRAMKALNSTPIVVALTIIVAVAAILRISLGTAETLPRVLGDELLYVDLAKGFALHGEPLLRGKRDLGQSLLYPLFLSPAYRLASDGAAAFAAAKAMNAVAMSLTAVPAYLLARRIVPRGWSLGVAAGAVAVPWMQYSALTMTEPLFYPIFMAFALLLVLMLEKPTIRGQLAAVFVLLVLIGVRPQAIAVAGSMVLAIGLKGWLEGSLRAALRMYVPTLVVLGVTLVAGTSAAAAGVPVPSAGYSGLFNVRYGVVGVAKWALWNLATYELALGVVGLVAFPVALLRLLRRNANSRERTFGIAALSLFLGVFASVTALSASPYGLGILHERSLFYVTPLVLICLAYWLADGLPRPPWVAGSAALIAVVVAASLPAGVLQRTNNVDGPTATFLAGFHGVASDVPLRLWLVAAAVIGCAAVLLARRPLFPVAAVTLAFVSVTAAGDLAGPLSARQDRELAWVDRALPDGATATLVHVDLTRPNLPCAEVTEYEQQGLLVWAEFFNTRIDRLVHVYGTRGGDNLPAPVLTVGSNGVLASDGRLLEPGYVVIDSRQPIVGTRLQRFDLTSIASQFQNGASLTLWKVAPPLKLTPPPSPLPPRADGHGC